MLSRITAVQYLRDYTLRLQFSDGAQGEVDLAGDLAGPMFEPLQDRRLFAQARLHPELRAVVWPNGADLAPEFLRDRIRVPA